jgi:uncharacterized membrane protein YraQ (UPF0718 family)
VSLRKQGANKGAVTSFLISTPESGVDSIAITYALLDPLLTVMRPVTAFFTAAVAGVTENLTTKEKLNRPILVDRSCPVDGCCDGEDCSPEEHRNHHSFFEKTVSGLRYAFTDFWSDLAGYFFFGLLLAGVITALVPDSFFATYLGSGLPAMLIMLLAGIPLYVCATASTPIAAALILKGVSPGAALVFLLVGPATNMAALAVISGTLGKRSTAIYLASIAVCAVFSGLLVDASYEWLDISPQAAIGQAVETIPHWLALAAGVFLILLSIGPLWQGAKMWMVRKNNAPVTPSDPLKSDEIMPVAGCGPT